VCSKIGKRKKTVDLRVNDDMPYQPERKLRKTIHTGYMNRASNSANSRTVKESAAGSSSSFADWRPHRPARNSSSGVADCPPHRSAARQLKIEINEGTSYELVSTCHADDEHGSVDGGENFAGHSSVDDRSDKDKCPVCSTTFTTQEVGTPDTCDHTFCAACLKVLSKNENICPVDHRKFSFIFVRHHIGGEIITKMKLEPPNEQGRYNREDVEHVDGKFTFDHTICLGISFAIIKVLLIFARDFIKPFLDEIFQGIEEMSRNRQA
jgi:RNA polymerase subunit RPABC4/transcription elongation factor Spt4